MMSNGLLNASIFLSSSKEILPFDFDDKCPNESVFPKHPYFITADYRENQNSLLIVFHTIWIRGKKMNKTVLNCFN